MAWLALILSFLFSAAALADQPRVMASIKPLQTILAAIAGDDIQVDLLLDPGVSPHTYHLKPSDVARLVDSKALFWIGPDMETFLNSVLLSVKPQKVVTFEQLLAHDQTPNESEQAAQEPAHDAEGDDEHHHHHDAHLWMSPKLAIAMAEIAAQTFAELLPLQRDQFQQRLTAFKESVSAEQSRIHRQLAPFRDQGFYVAHDAYSYFVRDFGLKQLGALSISPDRQPGARHVTQLREALEQAKARCILVEPQFRPSYLKALTNGLEVRVTEMDPLGAQVPPDASGYSQLLRNLADSVEQCLRP